MTCAIGHDFAILGNNQPIFIRDGVFNRVVVAVEQNKDPPPTVAIRMVAQFVGNHTGNIFSKEPQFCTDCTGVRNPESRGAGASVQCTF